MRSRIALLLCVPFAIFKAEAAPAGQRAEYYWAASAGYVSEPDVSFAEFGPSAIEFSPGVSLEATLGRQRGRVRWEFLGTVETTPVRGGLFTGIEASPGVFIGVVNDANGRAALYSLMAGGTYQFTGPIDWVEPYIGGALGPTAAGVDIDVAGRSLFKGHTIGFGMRGLAGFNIKLSQGTRLFLEGRYRRFGPFAVENGSDLVFQGWGACMGLRFRI